MSTKKALRVKDGDIIEVNNCIIGVVRYVGYVNGLSNGKHDHYVGIEIKCKPQNKTIGIATDGKFSGYVYFNSSQDKGRFIREHMVTKKFSPEELFDAISNPISLIINFNDNVTTPSSPISEPKAKPKPPPKAKPKPPPKPKAKPTTAISYDEYDSYDDIGIIAKRVHSLCSAQEIEYFIKYCKGECFTEIDNIQADLEEFENNDSAIIEALKKQFAWNHTKRTKFVSLALERKYTDAPSSVAVAQNNEISAIKRTRFRPTKAKPPPKRLDSDEKESDISVQAITTQYKLPSISQFTVPTDIMKQRDPRSINDIVLCLRKNQISHAAVVQFKQFCNAEHYKFIDLETNLPEIRNKFKTRHRDLIVFMDYIEKCIYELSPPLFKAGNFTKNDEDNKKKYFEKQCKGMFKHDRDLLQYFCITQHTEKALASELIDIADRIAIEEKQELNAKNFAKKYFFKNCSKTQVKKVQDGLRKYHSRFLPVFRPNPVKQLADKISGYQKYCILLSHIVTEIEQQICSGYNQYNKNNALLVPYMIDMMIIPPGCFNKVEDANSKPYDSSGTRKIGDIKQRLSDFNIPINETRGLNDNANNFDSAITQRITKKIIEYIRKITDNFNKKNQRICIVVDRRWRINCEKFDAFNKLRRYNADIAISGNESGGMNEAEGKSTKHKKSGSWITKGFFGGGSGGYDENKDKKTNTSFYNKKYDTIYVYQANLGRQQKTSYHEFSKDYCHEALIYLTKQCIIPGKDRYLRIGGGSTEGWLFNISAHIQIPRNQLWYKYDQRWYIWLQSTALRFFPSDMHSLWPRYFIDVSEDTDRLTLDQIKRMFRINLEETDSSYKRWYYAIKRTD